jgi:hypothetical protein
MEFSQAWELVCLGRFDVAEQQSSTQVPYLYNVETEARRGEWEASLIDRWDYLENLRKNTSSAYSF